MAGAAFAFGRRRSFQARIERETAALLAARQERPGHVVSEADLERLPLPIQRWLRAAGVLGKPIPAVVRIAQEGEFRLGPDKSWMPFTATEYFTITFPGFLWKASMEMKPLVSIEGRDCYVQGIADIEMRLAGLVPVAKSSGGNLTGGALLRYLNEMMWFPAALLLPNIAWEPIDDASARATVTDRGLSVSAVFHIDPEGRLVNMTADRWNDTEHAFLPWSTPLTGYGTFAGLELPNAGSGVWKTGPDAYAYIRLRVTNVEYDPA